jgi:3-methylcrotonyl-CoA carboxylase alpha subunit
MRETVISVNAGGQTRRVVIDSPERATIDGETFDVAAASSMGEVIVTRGTAIERVFLARVADAIWVFHDGETYEVTIEADGGAPRRTQQGSLSAPMPATVVSVHAKSGDRVSKGAILIVLEAMKMELPVRAPADGVVGAIHCSPGDLVQPGVLLIEVQ